MERDVPLIRVEPLQVSELTLSLEDDSFDINGRQVGAIVSRCPPKSFLSDQYADQDLEFVNTEIRATWLAATMLPTVYAVNRLDPVAFFDDSEWIVWRSRLMEAGVSVSPFTFGNIVPSESPRFWLPHRSVNLRPAPDPLMQRVIGAALTPSCSLYRYAYAENVVLTPDAPPTVKETQQVLLNHGLRLAEVVLDEHQRVTTINPFPAFESNDRVAGYVVEAICDHLHLC